MSIKPYPSRIVLLFFLLVALSGCRTHTPWAISRLISDDKSALKIAVPYVSGDTDGNLTNQIIYTLQSLPGVQIDDMAENILKIKILDKKEERLGYRQDPFHNSHKIISNENRRQMLISVHLINRSSQKEIWNPGYILGSIDYDHENNSLSKNTLSLSLGQLADLETARDTVHIPLYRDISEKIAVWVQNQREIAPQEIEG